MSEKKLALSKVKKALEENNRSFKMWTSNAVMAEVRVKTYQKMIPEAERLHNIKLEKIRAQVDRSVKNAKRAHKALDDLLEEKEQLHLDLKAASHYGMVKCEYCENYFTSQGITRHKSACSSKPEVKIVEKHKAEIKQDKEDIEAKKAALREELAKLDKK